MYLGYGTWRVGLNVHIVETFFIIFLFIVINLKCNKINGRAVYCPIQAENCGFFLSQHPLSIEDGFE